MHHLPFMTADFPILVSVWLHLPPLWSLPKHVHRTTLPESWHFWFDVPSCFFRRCRWPITSKPTYHYVFVYLIIVQYVIVYSLWYNQYVEEYAPTLVPPEARLKVTLFVAPLFAISSSGSDGHCTLLYPCGLLSLLEVWWALPSF